MRNTKRTNLVSFVESQVQMRGCRTVASYVLLLQSLFVAGWTSPPLPPNSFGAGINNNNKRIPKVLLSHKKYIYLNKQTAPKQHCSCPSCEAFFFFFLCVCVPLACFILGTSKITILDVPVWYSPPGEQQQEYLYFKNKSIKSLHHLVN